MKLPVRLAAAAGLAVLTTSCGSEPPVEVGNQELCDDKDYRDRDVIVEGTVDLPSFFFTYGNGVSTIVLDDGEQIVEVNITEGTGANEIEPLPENYADEDLVLRTDDLQTLGVGSKARITGRASTSGNGLICAINLWPEEEHTIVAINE